MAPTLSSGGCACGVDRKAIFPAAACRNILGPHIPVPQSIASRRSVVGAYSQAFACGLAGWRWLEDWEELAGPFPLAYHLKGKQHSACHRQTTWAGLMELPLGCGGQPGCYGAAAVVPVAPISALHSSNHKLTSSSSSPPTASQTWPLGLTGGRWGVTGDEGAEGQGQLWVQIREDGVALQSGDEQPRIPDQDVLASEVGLLPGHGRSAMYSVVQTASTENLAKHKWWEEPGGMGSEGRTNF